MEPKVDYDLSSVCLKEISRESVLDIRSLSVSEAQRKFVAENAVSIAQASFEDSSWMRGIYITGTPVGFVLLKDTEIERSRYLWRFMIDVRYQGQGIGSAALRLVIDDVRRDESVDVLLTSVVEEHGGPLRFYEKMGFRLTGEYMEGESVMRLRLH